MLLPVVVRAIGCLPAVPRGILDIGCNDGRFAAQVIRLACEVGAVGQPCRYVGVDPCQEALGRFRYSEFSSWVSIDLVRADCEAYVAKDDVTGNLSGGIALVSHSLYWTPDLRAALAGILRRVSTALFVVRGARGVFEVQERFRIAVPTLANNRFTVEDVEESLAQLGAAIERVDIQSSIYVGGSSQAEIGKLAAFCLDGPLASIPTQVLRDVSSYLTSFGPEFRHDVSVLVARVDL